MLAKDVNDNECCLDTRGALTSIASKLAPTEGEGEGEGGRITNRRKHKGEPKLPFNFVVTCSFFIIEGRSVFVFSNRDPLPLFLSTPIRDQEQTYFFER
ncbi:hypothetical protein PS914_04154 [Pseudomonas fluorescens]|nr:hypothetical protein PS914_04154 [Pseudomonas fluorescens]